VRERLDSRSVLLCLGVAAAGCQSNDSGIVDEELPAALRIEPPTVYFGLVEWGTTVSQPITLFNEGDEAADVDALVPSSDGFVVDDAGPFTIPPGGAVERTLEWTPDTFDGLDERLDILGPHIRAPSVSVTGGTSFAVLDVLSNEPAEFGAVPLGCASASQLTLANHGLVDLVVSWEPTITQAEFALRDSSSSSLETGVIIAPRSSEILDVEFAPTSIHEIESTLAIETNDPLAPVVEVDVRGEGVWNEPHSAQWTIGTNPQTILFHVNQRVVIAPWRARFEELLGAFFDALLAGNVPFRVAFLVDPNGQVDGPVPYIDDSFSSAEAVSAALEMLLASGGDNDAGLETCLQALEENAEWALDDELPWPPWKLNVVSINPDAEQSPGDATYYIQSFEELRGSSNLAIHGIAGDVPSGCGSGGTYADPSFTLNDAAEVSGGLFLSICDPDWTANAATLASACMRFTGFYFGEQPLPKSIEVSIDGVEVPTGWSYDAVTNELLFDDATLLPEGAHVRADYFLAGSCG
jgi:hypothetical protein